MFEGCRRIQAFRSLKSQKTGYTGKYAGFMSDMDMFCACADCTILSV